MTPEAGAYLNQIRTRLFDLTRQLKGLPPARGKAHNWLVRLDVLAGFTDDWLQINAMLNEFRRDYDHEVDPAELNHVVASAERAGRMIPEMIRVVGTGLSKKIPPGVDDWSAGEAALNDWLESQTGQRPESGYDLTTGGENCMNCGAIDVGPDHCWD